MNFILLTHEREFLKPSNTGKLVLESLGVNRCKRICWQRKQPDLVLKELIQNNQVVLVAPESQGRELSWCAEALNPFTHLLLIDGTWQQARKIYRQSPYLHTLPWVKIISDTQSSYRLRRNQTDGGLCTAECVIECLKVAAMTKDASVVERVYRNFNEGLVDRGE